jgi:hypothetical protein
MIRNKIEKTVKVDGKDVEIYVTKPSNQVTKEAERCKSKAWNEAIQDGVLTKKELAVLMTKRGIWDSAKDKKENEITSAILELEKELYHGKKTKGGKKIKPKVSEGRDIAIQIRRKRMELRELIAERISLEENTAESLADNARFDYLVACCTYFKDGKRVYQDYNEYNNKSADEIAFAAGQALGEMLYNLDSDFEKNLPENKFLTKFNLVNEDLSLVDPNNPEQLIDTTGKKIDEDGYFIDDEGHRVDKEGNVITEDGGYEMADYDNDLVVATKKSTTKAKENTES